MYGDVNADTYDAPNTPRMACGLVEARYIDVSPVVIPLNSFIARTIPMAENV
jgi:hypothetical protein